MVQLANTSLPRRHGVLRALRLPRAYAGVEEGSATSGGAVSYQMTELVRGVTVTPTGRVLTKDEKLVLMVISTYHNEAEGYAFPSLTRLANESVSGRSTLIRCLRRLVAERCLTTEKRRSVKGDWLQNAYRIADDLANPDCQPTLERAKVWKKKKGSGTTPVGDVGVVSGETLRSVSPDTTVVSPQTLPSVATDTTGSVALGEPLNGTPNGTSSKKKRHRSSEPAATSFQEEETETTPSAIVLRDLREQLERKGHEDIVRSRCLELGFEDELTERLVSILHSKGTKAASEALDHANWERHQQRVQRA